MQVDFTEDEFKVVMTYIGKTLKCKDLKVDELFFRAYCKMADVWDEKYGEFSDNDAFGIRKCLDKAGVRSALYGD